MLSYSRFAESQKTAAVKKELVKQETAYGHDGSGSGGYLEHVLVSAAQELFGVEMKHDQIVYRQLRNQDFREVNLEVSGEVKLRFACAYGFRNIQNIVQKIKKGSCAYHYVEIMACPSGCLNGGAQVREEGTNRLSRELLEK